MTFKTGITQHKSDIEKKYISLNVLNPETFEKCNEYSKFFFDNVYGYNFFASEKNTIPEIKKHLSKIIHEINTIEPNKEILIDYLYELINNRGNNEMIIPYYYINSINHISAPDEINSLKDYEFGILGQAIDLASEIN